MDLRRTEETLDNAENVYWSSFTSNKAGACGERRRQNKIERTNKENELTRNNMEKAGTQYYRIRSAREVKEPKTRFIVNLFKQFRCIILSSI